MFWSCLFCAVVWDRMSVQQNAKHLQQNLIGYWCDKNNVLKVSQAQNTSSENPTRVADNTFYTLSKFLRKLSLDVTIHFEPDNSTSVKNHNQRTQQMCCWQRNMHDVWSSALSQPIKKKKNSIFLNNWTVELKDMYQIQCRAPHSFSWSLFLNIFQTSITSTCHLWYLFVIPLQLLLAW